MPSICRDLPPEMPLQAPKGNFRCQVFFMKAIVISTKRSAWRDLSTPHKCYAQDDNKLCLLLYELRIISLVNCLFPADDERIELKSGI